MSTYTVCICCGEPLSETSHPASPNPNVCAACFDGPGKTSDTAFLEHDGPGRRIQQEGSLQKVSPAGEAVPAATEASDDETNSLHVKPPPATRSSG